MKKMGSRSHQIWYFTKSSEIPNRMMFRIKELKKFKYKQRVKYFTIILTLFLTSFGISTEAQQTKDIDVKKNLNLEVLFTVYNQIWTPFLDNGVSESMISNTRLMKMNHDYFKEFSDHKAIAKARSFMDRSGTDFFVYAFYYEDFPNAKRNREIPVILTRDINADRSLALNEIDSLMKDIADFYTDADFEEFYKVNDYVYEIAKNEVLEHIPQDDFILFLENYFGKEYSVYEFYTIPFFKTEFGMAHQLSTEDGIKNITFISPFEPAEIKSNNRIKYVGYESEDDILEWVVHEYSHVFFNPSLTQQKNLDLLNKYADLYDPIDGSPQIGDWFSMFSEHIAVAFEVRAAELRGNKTRALNIFKKHEKWKYLDHFVKQLEHYEKNRATYSNIGEFMPVLIKSSGKLR